MLLDGAALVYYIQYVALPLLLIIIFVIKNRKASLGLPHPRGWPFVGNALQMAQYGRSDQTLTAWAKQYGGIYSVQMFNTTWVVLSGYDEIHEALVQKGKIFSGRKQFFRFSFLVGGNKDITMSDPTIAHYMPMRKIMHRTIQPLGNHLTRIESVLVDMAQQFVGKIRSYEGRVVDVENDLYNFVCKVAIAMIIGHNVDDNSPFLADLKRFDVLSRDTTSPISGVELDFFPWLRHFGHPTWKKLKELSILFDKLFAKFWQAGMESYSTDEEPTCIVHAAAQALDKQSKFYEPTMTEQHAKNLIFDAVFASVVTTSNSAYVLANLFVHHPNAYKRLQEETDTVIGSDRPPNIFDRESMPYTLAAIFELLRIHSLAPALLPHMALEDTTVGGRQLPAGTIVVPLVIHLHHDEKFWGDPLVFRPERFLDESGKLLPPEHPNRKHLMPFGAGSRMCVGEVFAMRRLFIIATSVAQAFDIEPGDSLVSCNPADYIEGISLNQKPFTIRLIPRY